MDRWYMVFVQATLFEPVAVICTWGNRRNSYQQLRVLPAGSQAEALATAQKIVEQKLARGYERVSEGQSDSYTRPSSRKMSRRTATISASSALVIAGRGIAKASPATVSK